MLLLLLLIRLPVSCQSSSQGRLCFTGKCTALVRYTDTEHCSLEVMAASTSAASGGDGLRPPPSLPPSTAQLLALIRPINTDAHHCHCRCVYSVKRAGCCNWCHHHYCCWWPVPTLTCSLLLSLSVLSFFLSLSLTASFHSTPNRHCMCLTVKSWLSTLLHNCTV